ncbi:hypothetical protein KR222_010409 [Zaprionus bogoriensis]|nr:hypothetical protein KR222_010409 [Zaprionus bogoriensis]
MEHLNDDILLHILDYLDFQSQRNMVEVHPRFEELLSILWRSKYKTVSMSLFECNFSNEQFRHFLQSICQSVTVLHLRMMNEEHFGVLISYCFPSVHDFRFATVPSRLLSDADIPKIVKAFPNLKTFSPHGNFSGLHFADFPQLERLTLSYCRGFSVENLVNIMRAHLLKELRLCLFDRKSIESSNMSLPVEYMTNLESLKIEFDELSWFEDHLKTLSNLKELTVRVSNQLNTLNLLIIKMDYTNHPRNFNILETCNTSDTLWNVIVAKLRVNSLKIVTDNFLLDDINHFTPSCFENIKQLYFKNCLIKGKNLLDHLMRHILNVEFVSFEQCSFAFDYYGFNVLNITVNRRKALQVNLHENTFLKTVSFSIC